MAAETRDEFELRRPCAYCGHAMGFAIERSGQDVVHCGRCERYAGYNRPKSESGKPQRHVGDKNREPIKPGERYRILERDGFRCVACGSSENLHVGHLLSVDDAVKQDIPKEVYEHDQNKAAMCEQCNLGQKQLSIEPRLFVAILIRRIARAKAAE